MKSIVLVFILSVASFVSSACLNEITHTIDGRELQDYFAIPKFYRAFDTSFSKKYVEYYDLSKRDSIPFEELSDVSVQLAKLGRYDESLELLLWINARHPDIYQVNANLGTLYELTGNVDSAYFFIENSMKLNPDSHEGSEWIHLAILKAKQKMKNNPDWIFKNRVLNLNLAYKVELHSDLHNQIDDTISAINYQMVERIPFTPVPDPILANIFDEMGDILAQNFSVREAYIAYMISGEYDPEDKFKTITKRKKIEAMVQKEDGGFPVLEYYFSAPDEYDEMSDYELPGEKNNRKNNKSDQSNAPVIEEEKPVSQSTNFWLWPIISGSFLLVIFFIIRLMKKK